MNISNFNTKNVINMEGMFYESKCLQSLDLSNFNTEKVENMSLMFRNCISLTTLNLSNFNTENLKSTYAMCSECVSLKYLYLNNSMLTKTESISGMFSGCNNLIELTLYDMNTLNNDIITHVGTADNIKQMNLLNFNIDKLYYIRKLGNENTIIANMKLNKKYYDINCNNSYGK